MAYFLIRAKDNVMIMAPIKLIKMSPVIETWWEIVEKEGREKGAIFCIENFEARDIYNLLGRLYGGGKFRGRDEGKLDDFLMIKMKRNWNMGKWTYNDGRCIIYVQINFFSEVEDEAFYLCFVIRWTSRKNVNLVEHCKRSKITLVGELYYPEGVTYGFIKKFGDTDHATVSNESVGNAIKRCCMNNESCGKYVDRMNLSAHNEDGQNVVVLGLDINMMQDVMHKLLLMHFREICCLVEMKPSVVRRMIGRI